MDIYLVVYHRQLFENYLQCINRIQVAKLKNEHVVYCNMMTDQAVNILQKEHNVTAKYENNQFTFSL